MNKVVLKTALVTVCALIILGVAVFIVWFFAFPQSMATLCERTGNYSFALTCSARRYSYTGETEDLARCAEDAILSGKDELIIEYGEKLVSEKDFSSVCAEKDAKLSSGTFGEYTVNYKSYICGNLAAAQYRQGDIGKALTTALSSGEVQSFIKLVIAVADSNNAQDKLKVLAALADLTPSTGDFEILENLKAILT